MKHQQGRSAPASSFIVASVVGLTLGLPSPALGQLTEDLKLLPEDGSAGDQFGYSTAIADGVVAIGARQDDENGSASGSAYLFDGATGTQLAKLQPADGAAGDEFGFSIAASDGIVVVGARFDDDNGENSGSAYLFDAATGTQLDKLLPSDGAAGDEFGFAVAIGDGVVAVGAKRDDDSGVDSGSLYLFDAATGEQVEKVVPSDGAANQNFGESVDIDEGIVAVGAHGDDDNGPLAGAAYLFDASSGSQITKLLPIDGGANDFFGSAIAIDDGVVVVGAWADSIFFDHSGSAYLFDASSGSQITKLIPSDGHDRDHFGFSVDIDAGVLVIGADGDDDAGFDAGSAYLYDVSTASQITKILASDGAVLDEFGASVAIAAGVVVVGAHCNDDNGSSSGSAYVFETIPCGSTRNYCTSTPNSSGTAATMGVSGSTSIAANDLVLTCEDGPADKFGLFFHGPNQIQAPFGDGFRCVGGSAVRTPVVQTDAEGFASRPLDLASAPGIAPGAARNFQFWFRDPAGPGGSGFNLSDGLEATFCE